MTTNLDEGVNDAFGFAGPNWSGGPWTPVEGPSAGDRSQVSPSGEEIVQSTHTPGLLLLKNH